MQKKKNMDSLPCIGPVHDMTVWIWSSSCWPNRPSKSMPRRNKARHPSWWPASVGVGTWRSSWCNTAPTWISWQPQTQRTKQQQEPPHRCTSSWPPVTTTWRDYCCNTALVFVTMRATPCWHVKRTWTCCTFCCVNTMRYPISGNSKHNDRKNNT